MPVLDWNNPAAGGLGIVIDWNTGGVGIEAPPSVITYQFLHAQITSTLYHAEGTTGESTPVALDYNIVDEAGNQIVDEAGNPLVSPGSDSAILLHAKETNTLYHAEA